jgi:hypothetical protein
MRILIIVLAAILGLGIIAWAGLQIKPRPLAPYPATTPSLETVPLPDNLPAPVARFYRAIYGDEVPIIESAVISGRARMRLFGITFPARFRFTHIAGQDYRHYIEVTLFGLPIMKVNEYYIAGEGRMELPMGVIEDEPKVNQGANLGLWGESAWFPAIYLTDPRARWEAVDDETALLRVPFGDAEQTFVVRFDPETNMLRYLEAMRYRDADDEHKILWIDEAREWRVIDGHMTMGLASVTWFDEGSPWVVFDVDELVYNADVSEHIRAAGP